MKKMYLVISITLITLLNGCASVSHLDRLGEIPHEGPKGYVKFVSDFDTDNKDAFSWHPQHGVKKIEHGCEVDIVNLALSGESYAIANSPGNHRYIIEHPVFVAIKVKNGLIGKTKAEKEKLKLYEITEKEFRAFNIPNHVWSGANKNDRKEVQISIRENMITLVGVKSVFTYHEERRLVIKNEKNNKIKETNDTVKIFNGTVEIKTGRPFEISAMREDDIDFLGSPAYDMDKKMFTRWSWKQQGYWGGRSKKAIRKKAVLALR
ncbi:MAG: hypothetical protein KAJ66_01600 [Candidatus Omnitrophica bacterium]|nr:hypothetical protein [Candidatus Omnitrophota bacterium]